MEIVQYPHPALRYKSVPVQEINASLRKTVEQMFELMYNARGIGLAANQVALPYRLFVINLTAEADQKDQEMVFINPSITRRRGQEVGEEGCLSFPELYGPVERSTEIVVEAFDLQGGLFRYELEGLAARAVQHEYDHIEGVLFIDRLSELERQKALPVLEDFEYQHREAQNSGKLGSDEHLVNALAAMVAMQKQRGAS
ncbi:MAG: peptide deformylase [Planctomycetaceae bacterium]|nr:peptide deformylase [Planctomycetaceae bacterium]